MQKLKIIEKKSEIPPFSPPPPPPAEGPGLGEPEPGGPPPDKLALLNSGYEPAGPGLGFWKNPKTVNWKHKFYPDKSENGSGSECFFLTLTTKIEKDFPLLS